MQVLCLCHYGLRKSNRRLRSELHKQQIIYCDTLWPQSFGTCKVLWQIQQFMSYCTAFAFFYFEFDGNQVPSTLDLGDCIWSGWFIGGFFCVTILGGLHLEGRIDGGVCFWNFAVVIEDFKQSKFNGWPNVKSLARFMKSTLSWVKSGKRKAIG